jgi:hypothetical protein
MVKPSLTIVKMKMKFFFSFFLFSLSFFWYFSFFLSFLSFFSYIARHSFSEGGIKIARPEEPRQNESFGLAFGWALLIK